MSCVVYPVTECRIDEVGMSDSKRRNLYSVLFPYKPFFNISGDHVYTAIDFIIFFAACIDIPGKSLYKILHHIFCAPWSNYPERMISSSIGGGNPTCKPQIRDADHMV